ncbi:MAG TPA: helix-turn-helix domain-containing protein [Polyangiaceae bacterium]|nr:helix-turn-helix domain-containing protein [Polyangiaceae bacterium]
MATKPAPTGRTLQGSERDAFIERLTQLVSEAGFSTMRDFSESSGIAEPTLSRLKNANRGASTPTLIRVAEALGVTLDRLLGLEGPQSVREAAVGQLVLEHTKLAGIIAEVAAELTLDHPDLADVPRAKQLIMGMVAAERGKDVPNRASQGLDDGTATGGRGTLKRKKGAG